MFYNIHCSIVLLLIYYDIGMTFSMSQNSLLPCYVSFSWKTLKNRWEEQCCTVIAYVFLNLKKKWPNKVKILFFSADAKMLKDDTSVRPREASTEDLLVVHPKKYLDSLRVSALCPFFEYLFHFSRNDFIISFFIKIYRKPKPELPLLFFHFFKKWPHNKHLYRPTSFLIIFEIWIYLTCVNISSIFTRSVEKALLSTFSQNQIWTPFTSVRSNLILRKVREIPRQRRGKCKTTFLFMFEIWIYFTYLNISSICTRSVEKVFFF